MNKTFKNIEYWLDDRWDRIEKMLIFISPLIVIGFFLLIYAIITFIHYIDKKFNLDIASLILTIILSFTLIFIVFIFIYSSKKPH